MDTGFGPFQWLTKPLFQEVPSGAARDKAGVHFRKARRDFLKRLAAWRSAGLRSTNYY